MEKENKLNELNSKQKEACVAADGPSLIIAGAGSGKTRVLTYRIAYLIYDMNVDPCSILAITFTNKAAKEMRDRLEVIIGNQAKDVTAQTFHSFCASFLRHEIYLLEGRKRTFQIIDDDEALTIIKNQIIALNYDIKSERPQSYQDIISAIKSRMKDLNSYEKFLKEKIELVMKKYNDYLLQNNLLDFDDLILLTMEILENNPNVLERYQEIYRYILVDEFQDTSNLQYDLIHLLGQKYQNVLIVGDEDQSIYSFRGANINNIKKFMRDFPTYHKYVLDQNYRSTKNILDAANSLISHNVNRIPKNLWTEKDEGMDVLLTHQYSDKQEATEISNQIERLVSYQGYTYSDIAVLYRNNYLSRNFENSFIQNQIPYAVYSGLSFYQRKEVKDLVAYLRFILDSNEFYSFKRIIGSPKRGIGDITIKKLETAIDKYHVSILEALDLSEIGANAKDNILNFLTITEGLKTKMNSLPLMKFLNEVYGDTGYLNYINTLDIDEKETRDENIKELFNAIAEIQSEKNEDTLKDFLGDVALKTDFDIETTDPNHVSLMSMHACKGLEFKVVFITALEEGIIPSPRAGTLSEIEEERRLLYVAMTRAKERLFLSSSDFRFRNGMSDNSFPSRFIRDIVLKNSFEHEKNIKVTKKEFQIHQETVYPKGAFNVGDRVSHLVLGLGTIQAEFQGYYIIKFDDVLTPKKIIVNHPLLKKA